MKGYYPSIFHNIYVSLAVVPQIKSQSISLSLVSTSDIRIISTSIIININISFLCSSGNACTKNSRVSVVYRSLNVCFNNGAHAICCVNVTAAGIRGSYNATRGTSPLSYYYHSLHLTSVTSPFSTYSG